MIFMVVSIHAQSSRKAVEMLLEPVGMLSEGFRKVSEFVGILSKDVTDYAHDSSILNTAQTTARLDKTIYRSYRARVDNPSTKSFARARKWSANYIVALICIGFFLGGLVGARIATALSNAVLEKVFGVTLLLIALKMIFAK
jgi:hypothetical protein